MTEEESMKRNTRERKKECIGRLIGGLSRTGEGVSVSELSPPLFNER